MNSYQYPRTLFLAISFLLFGADLGSSTVGAGNRVASPEEIWELNLTVDRTVGMSPLTIRVRGTLRGVPRGNGMFCHPGVTWQVWSLATHQILRSSHSPRCHHNRSEVFVPRSFTNSFTLGPGTHLCRLTVLGRDGTSVSSNLVRVKVL